jgi:dTDP-4-dehydrorhamnose 3,5-epimerase
MKFSATPLAGAFVLEIEPHCDERGFFARTFCIDEMAAHGLDVKFAQCSISYNKRDGTLRGLHFQVAPHEESKLVRVTSGAIFDVIVDIRSESPTYRCWFGAELTSQNRKALYVPKGFAHGFLTLTDDAEVFYQISAPHSPEASRGLRWNDEAVGITWPASPKVISARDASYPSLTNPRCV